ncbi:MAG: DNA polymerase [Pyrinomonadaceae bacterium]
MEQHNYQVIKTAEELRAAVDQLSVCDAIGFDTETTSLDPFEGRVRLLQLSAPDRAYVIDLDRFVGSDAQTADALAPIRRLLAAPRPIKVAHNAKFDAKWVGHYLGVELGGTFDTLLASQLISAGDSDDRHNLDAVSGRYIGESIDKSEQVSDWSGELSESQLDYAARDAAVMLPLRDKMIARLRSDELVRCAQLEFECVLPVAGLELTGIFLDKERWREVLGDVEKKRATLAEELQQMLSEGTSQGMLFANARTDVNLDSHTQLTAALKRLGVPLPDSTRNWKLQPLAKDYPVIATLLEYRTVQKALTSYGENILDEISPVTGRIHANFHQIGAPTGRFSCLTGDALVSTATGLKRMDSVCVGDYVATTYGLKKVERAWMTGVRPVYKIMLQDGREISATAEHRFLAGQADVWKRLDELKIGENLFVSLRRDHNLTGGQPPYLPVVEAEEIRARKIVKVPNKLSISLCELMGLIIADGFLGLRHERPALTRGRLGGGRPAVYDRICLAFHREDQELIDHVCRISEELFGQPFKEVKSKTCRVMQLASTKLAQFFASLGLQGKAHTKRVPGIVIGAGRVFQGRSYAACLRGWSSQREHHRAHER